MSAASPPALTPLRASVSPEGEPRNIKINENHRSNLGVLARRETGGGVAEHCAVIDAQGFDPALLSEGERDEKSELNQLGNREVLV
jgi:hypothetical protein